MGINAVNVIYITGYGRSGSTVLDGLLGQMDGLVSVGELDAIWTYGYLNDYRCSCGLAFSKCEFWQTVTEEAFGSLGKEQVNDVIVAKNALRMRNIPLLAFRAIRPRGFSQNLDMYMSSLTALLNAIRVVSGAQVIVDSSKIPTILYAFSEMANIDWRILHLVRDSRAVAYSYQRRKAAMESESSSRCLNVQGVVSTALAWDRWNLLAEGIRFFSPKVTRVRYEDYIQEPQVYIEKLLSSLVEETPSISFPVKKASTFKQDHAIAGNPVRFDRSNIVLKPDVEWRQSMDASKRRIVTALTWPLLRRYGYIGRMSKN